MSRQPAISVKVELLKKINGIIKLIPYPPVNEVLMAEKVF
jgi:hypothetical protein